MQNVTGQPQAVQVPNYSGVNIQIFNPAVAAPGGTVPTPNVNSTNYTTSPMSYPPNYYTNNYNPVNQQQTPAMQPVEKPNYNAIPKEETKTEAEKKKMEKREIVQLSDDYIKNLENYLNSQNTEIRMTGAKEVLARLQEDPSRKDDKALNALVNKMLQDPTAKIRAFALSALESRMASGDDYTVKVLKGMQQQKTAYGQDALQASNILLKMSGPTVTKEFEVKEKPKTEAKKEDKKSEKTENGKE